MARSSQQVAGTVSFPAALSNRHATTTPPLRLPHDHETKRVGYHGLPHIKGGER